MALTWFRLTGVAHVPRTCRSRLIDFSNVLHRTPPIVAAVLYV